MAAMPRVAPRFVPTLTEVVQGPVGAAPVLRPAAQPSRPSLDADLMIEWVQAEVSDTLNRNLHDLIANALVEQVDLVSARLRQEIEPLVRQAVVDAVANEMASRDRP